MGDGRHNPYQSWSRPGVFADPDSPAGGSGPGHAANAEPRADDSAPFWQLPSGSVRAALSAYVLGLPAIVIEQRLKAVRDAIVRAPGYVPRAIYDATGEELGETVKGIVPGLLMLLGVMAVTTAFGVVVGAALGALLGALAFGVGAVPGAVAGGEVGGQLGFDAGVALLNWLGVPFLVAYIGKSVLQCAQTAAAAVEMAWKSVDDHGTQQVVTDRAAHKLAEAVGQLFRGLLQGIVAFLLAKGSAAAAERLPELVARLRASKLGAGFAEWIEKNALRLIKEPKLRDDLAPPGAKDGGGALSRESKVLGEEGPKESAGGQTQGGGEQGAAEEPVAEKADIKPTEKSPVDPAHIAELKANGVKFTPEDVVATGQNADGKVVFLEKGNSRAGLQHIVERHSGEFAKIGVPESEIPDVVMKAVTEGRIVGYQGAGAGRPIYEIQINGQPQRIAVTTGSNGFIVGANPAGGVK